MSIEDPISYADWYWKHSVDATKSGSRLAEQTYAPIISQFFSDTGILQYIPNSLKPLFGIIASPAEDFWDDIQRPFLNTLTRVTSMAFGEEIARPGVYAMKSGTPTLKIDAEMAAILTQRRLMSDAAYNVYASFAGYDEAEASQFYKTRLPYPQIPDIITASRYLGDAFDPEPYAQSLFDIPENDYKIWDWLSYQKLTTQQVQELFKRRVFNEADTNKELARIGWHEYDGFMIKSLAHSLPNPMLMAQGLLLQDANFESILDGVSEADIKPTYAKTYLDAIMTKPATEDIIAYELRRDPSLSNLHTELRRIGIHPNYNGLYKELAYQIPPVADIITMAVREAFTPAIAARFGQYEDLPSDFVTWVQKKGLSKEWAERYWAAHWSLPSPSQGFEMLHRGIIGRDDLYLLMRALDIMPFWRDKLIEMAYRPLTRIDVRRMYNLGILDVSGVNKAYRDLGYNDYNANLMTQFTVKIREAAIEREEKPPKPKPPAEKPTWTNAQTLTFFKKKLIDEERARKELTLMGYDEEHINVYMASVIPAP